MLLALLITFATVGVLMLVLSIYLIVKLFGEAKLSAVFRTGVEGENMTFALTDAYLSKIKCFRKVWLRSPNAEDPVYAEQILICRGGVFVISSFNERGRVQNPIDNDWTLTNGKQMRLIPNPFYKNFEALTCIEELIEQAGLARPVIYSVAVVTETQIEFTNSYDLLVPADEFPSCMKRLTRNRFYSKRAVRKFARILEERRASMPSKIGSKYNEKRFS